MTAAGRSRNRRIPFRALTREAFAPFGDLVSTAGARHYPINAGSTERYHDLAAIEVLGPDARPIVSVFRGKPVVLPMPVRMLERHPLGSQAFFPLQDEPWIAVVAPDNGGKPGVPVAFWVEPDAYGLRGLNYRANTWHHPLIALNRSSDFLVVDRGGEGDNLEEYSYPEPWLLDRP
jgi:ureidoglycolate lyase